MTRGPVSPSSSARRWPRSPGWASRSNVWFDVERVAAGYTGVFCSLIDKVIGYDPEYFDLFWSEPGYLGADLPASLAAARVQHDTTISQVVLQSEATELGLPMSMSAMFGDSEQDMPAALRLAELPEGNLQGASLILNSGDGKGAMLHIAQVIGDLVMTGFGENNADAMRRFKAGDEVSVDNSIYLASQTYHRHQVPDIEEYPVFAQFCVGGEPIYPQRPEIIGMKFAQGGGGSIQSGRFAGKMIVVEAMMDETCSPWQADWYRSRVAGGPRRRPRRPLPGLVHRARHAHVAHRGRGRPSTGPHDPGRLLRRRAPAGPPGPERLGRERPGAAGVDGVRGGRRPDRGAADRRGAQEHPGRRHRDRQRRGPGRGRGRRGRRVHRRRRRAAGHGHRS